MTPRYELAGFLWQHHMGDRDPQKVARAAGLPESTLSRILTGERKIDPCKPEFGALCRELGLDVVQRREIALSYGLDAITAGVGAS